MSTRIAYLVSRHPSLSHAFIDREITALRERGRDILTVSVRPARPGDLQSPAAREEAARTHVLLGSGFRPVVGLAIRFGLRHPGVLLRGVTRALRTGSPHARARLWQLFYLAEAVALLDLLDRERVRHVHVHFANNAADIARAAVALGNDRDGTGPAGDSAGGAGWTWSFSMHGPTEFEDPVGFDLAAKVTSAAAVACISDYCRSQLMRWSPQTLWSRLHLVRMSVDTDAYPPADRSGREGAPLRVLFVGRLVAEKGPTVLLDAVDLLVSAGDVPLEVAIVGGGELTEDLAQLVSRRSLGPVVTLVGPLTQDELPARYAWADVFCLPSFAEGLPVVLMEAMATGLPVLTTRITGVPELVEDGVNGLLVPAGRADALAEGLRRLHGDPLLRAELGRAGRARVLAEFTPGPNAALLDAVLP